jgi:hypothetical protein
VRVRRAGNYVLLQIGLFQAMNYQCNLTAGIERIIMPHEYMKF